MTEGSMPSSPNQEDSSISLHEWISVLCWVSGFLLAWILVAICANWLGDFLHAPLGIKDNPPEPGILVQYAQLAVYPVTACFIALRVLKYFSGVYSTKDFLLGCAGALICILVVVLLAGEVLHREFIAGTFYFWKTLAPSFMALLFLLFDGWVAGALVLHWKSTNSVRTKLATVLFVLSTAFGIVALIGLCVPSEKRLTGFAIIAIILFISGLTSTPLDKSKPTTSEPFEPKG
jgi:hypothetical protein